MDRCYWDRFRKKLSLGIGPGVTGERRGHSGQRVLQEESRTMQRCV